MTRALALFSGGLDSILACRVLMAQGIDVVALRFITPFFAADVGDAERYQAEMHAKYADVYGDLSGTWNYGPLGVQLKRNIMNLWWRRFVDERDDIYGVDAAILMNQKIWQASGHVDTFSDQ